MNPEKFDNLSRVNEQEKIPEKRGESDAGAEIFDLSKEQKTAENSEGRLFFDEKK